MRVFVTFCVLLLLVSCGSSVTTSEEKRDESVKAETEKSNAVDPTREITGKTDTEQEKEVDEVAAEKGTQQVVVEPKPDPILEAKTPINLDDLVEFKIRFQQSRLVDAVGSQVILGNGHSNASSMMVHKLSGSGVLNLSTGGASLLEPVTSKEGRVFSFLDGNSWVVGPKKAFFTLGKGEQRDTAITLKTDLSGLGEGEVEVFQVSPYSLAGS